MAKLLSAYELSSEEENELGISYFYYSLSIQELAHHKNFTTIES
jgi:hypothetical protein